MSRTYIIGDIHGYDDRLAALLHEAGLTDSSQRWCGGEAVLWFMGDYTDRGPDGIAVIDRVMRLQQEAPQAGGRVVALLGNHDIQLLAAQRFRHRASTGPGKTFLTDWQRNGGIANDLARLNARHIEWLSALPAMALEDDRLFIHADARLYSEYGDSVAAVNDNFYTLLHSDDDPAWDKLLEQFSEHKAFYQQVPRVLELLERFGGQQVIHGHTPIMTVHWQAAEKITAPLVYADGLCVNVDGGLYKGGPGFVYELPPIYELAPVV